MNFTKLKLVPPRTITESKNQEQKVKVSLEETKTETNSFDINSLVMKKQLIHMRESKRVDWRTELKEEEKEKDHPYVDVMPGGETEKDILKTLRKKKKEQE